MSNLHLGPDSQKPPEVKGQVRLYGMKYCPFTHRIRLILSYKKIPHDNVNINIKNKPKWYLEIHPEGKVPALFSSFLILNIRITFFCDFQLISIFSNCIHGNDSRPINEIIAEISSLLIEFEEELKTRGTVYFGGTQPGMLDILMWPWVERRKSLSLIYEEPTHFNDGSFSHLMKWMQEMKAQPFIQENECSHEKFAQLVKDLKTGNVDFDKL
ncbi:pyrimidodiazepine synthase-like [Apis dorsata]|uniref:pyrimidodiazepine synthase-like n=1 Tax=Apis dorsata TaxID=7462 RepID=UPI001292EF3B|nr:pyrimidodiazepine synthase-like [Apis dorsata]